MFVRCKERYMPRAWQGKASLLDRLLFLEMPLPDDSLSWFSYLDASTDIDSFAVLPGQRKAICELLDRGYLEVCGKNEVPDLFNRPRCVDTLSLMEIHWAVTGKCNLRCRHCFMEAPLDKYPEPEYSDVLYLLDQIAEANIPFLSVTGGEPFTYPYLRTLIRDASDRGIAINEIVTNGTLLDAEFLDFLDSCRQHPIFQISHDGVGIHDRMRGVKGSEEAAMKAIKLCASRGYLVAVTSIFSRENIAALGDTYTSLKDERIGSWMISRAQTTGMWKGGPSYLPSEVFADELLDLHARWLQDGKPLHIIMEDFCDALPIKRYQSGFLHYTADSLECGDTKRRLFLLSDGTILPCPGFAGTDFAKKMPNLYHTRLSSVLQQSVLTDFCAETKEKRLQNNPQCGSCEFFGECGMGCRARALTENKNMNAVDPVRCESFRSGWRKEFEKQEELKDEWQAQKK